MSAKPKNPEQGEREPSTYIGGLRWRKGWNVSSPLAKLTIEPNGLSVIPSGSHYPLVWRVLGVPTLHLDWSEIGVVELVSSLFSRGRPEGVSFVIGGKRLVFGCEPSVAEAIVDEVAQYVPQKIVRREKPKLVI